MSHPAPISTPHALTPVLSHALDDQRRLFVKSAVCGAAIPALLEACGGGGDTPPSNTNAGSGDTPPSNTGTNDGASSSQPPSIVPLQQAVLDWATSLVSVLPTAEATLLSRDIEAMRNSTFTIPTSFSTNYVPTIPNFASNPHALAAEKKYTALIATETQTPFNPFPSAPNLNTVSNDVLELFLAFCTHGSALYQNASVVTSILNRVECLMASQAAGNTLLGAVSFLATRQIAEIYLLLKKVFPALVLTSRDSIWVAAVQRMGQSIASSETYLSNPTIAGSWPNEQVLCAVTLAFADLACDTTNWQSLWSAELNFLNNNHIIYPDGAVAYYELQNDVYTYHALMIVSLGRFYQVTSNATALALIQSQKLYYPTSYTMSDAAYAATPYQNLGVSEYITAVAWKKYWNAGPGTDGIAVIAGLTGESMNVWMSKMLPTVSSYATASYYRPDVVPTAIPQSYCFWDRNVLGPRAKFNGFCWVATGRSDPSTKRGKATCAGAYLMVNPKGSDTPSWPTTAAVEEVSTWIYKKSATALATEWSGNTGPYVSSQLLNMKCNETSASTATSSFGSLSSSHNLQGFITSPNTSWVGRESWLLMQKRIVGLVRVSASLADSAYGLCGTIKLVSGRNSWGVKRALTQTSANTFAFGGMAIKFWAYDYANISSNIANTWADTGNKAVLLQLKDTTSYNSTRSYPTNTSRYFLVEIYPASNAGATDIAVLNTVPGLDGFSVQEADGTGYSILTNFGASAVNYTAANNAKVYPSGIQYRPSWLPSDSSMPQSLSYAGYVPAGQHIVQLL